MANGKRTSNQTAVLVFAILALIAGAFAIIGGIGAIAGGAIISAESGSVSATADGITMTGADIGGFATIAGVVVIISGILALLEGIFGIRAANDASKAMPYIIVASITLAAAIMSLIIAAVNGGADYSAISSVIIDAVCVWLGIKVKNEAAAL